MKETFESAFKQLKENMNKFILNYENDCDQAIGICSELKTLLKDNIFFVEPDNFNDYSSSNEYYDSGCSYDTSDDND